MGRVMRLSELKGISNSLCCFVGKDSGDIFKYIRSNRDSKECYNSGDPHLWAAFYDGRRGSSVSSESPDSTEFDVMYFLTPLEVGLAANQIKLNSACDYSDFFRESVSFARRRNRPVVTSRGLRGSGIRDISSRADANTPLGLITYGSSPKGVSLPAIWLMRPTDEVVSYIPSSKRS